jgi:hypothetical protein
MCFSGSASLLYAIFDDETFFLQAGQRGVNLGWFDIPIFLAADHRLKSVV